MTALSGAVPGAEAVPGQAVRDIFSAGDRRDGAGEAVRDGAGAGDRDARGEYGSSPAVGAGGTAAAGAARRVRVRVPATSANLGPGFDAFGLALGLYDEVDVEVTASGLTVDVVGPDEVAQDETHLVVRAIRATFDLLGRPQPGLALRCVNRIPHGRGLGSSAAAIVAGIVAAAALTRADLGPEFEAGAAANQGAPGVARPGVPSDVTAAAIAAGPGSSAPAEAAWMLRLAHDIEGHPDNVAAALSGGFTVAWQDVEGARCLRVDPFAELRPVVFVPTVRQSTEASRGALPALVGLPDAARTLGRAALLALTMSAAEPAGAAQRARTLFSATEDLLHQPYRLPAAPATGELVARLRALGVPATLSGSGPSVLALAVGGEQAAAAVGAASSEFSVAPLSVDRLGAQVTRLDPER
ncbi:homoserine kinase [Frankia torreyi]|uniref:Homoserine kinase n=1 Tax=Frankia torreyi TaxID=1856 RepID=A0A0D8BFZ4_9ACTN|nr:MULTISPECIES: homoserine kinase [Frankia]KJE22980.1 homoserine kinase [Frankia torreyi]